MDQTKHSPQGYCRTCREIRSHSEGFGSGLIRKKWRSAQQHGWGRSKGIMIDGNTMRSLMENTERAAEESLLEDSAFYEACQALKREIDNDPQVRSTVSELQAAGRRVFDSFVPRIKIRVKTAEGVLALPEPAPDPVAGVDEVTKLTRSLRDAASAVIKKSRYYRKLDAIVNEAVGASDRFEGIDSKVESAGYEVAICLDLSAYAQVRGLIPPRRAVGEEKAQISHQGADPIALSGADRRFLKDVGIRTEGS
jgi:hypothetical protein